MTIEALPEFDLLTITARWETRNRKFEFRINSQNLRRALFETAQPATWLIHWHAVRDLCNQAAAG